MLILDSTEARISGGNPASQLVQGVRRISGYDGGITQQKTLFNAAVSANGSTSVGGNPLVCYHRSVLLLQLHISNNTTRRR